MPDEPDDFPEAPPLRPSPLDLSHATPALWKALAEAQAKAHTVGKDGRNRDAGYNYATADSMIRGGARARAEAGSKLAIVTTWEQIDLAPPPGAGQPNGPGQWPSAEVTLHWALGCEDGGYIAGTISTHAIGSRRRPPDKATAAAATYAEGFVERNLMRLDRAEEGEDDVDRRPEVDTSTAAEAGREPLSFQAGQNVEAKAKPAKKPSKAEEERTKIAAVQANVRTLWDRLGGKAWKGWSAVLEGAGIDPKKAHQLSSLIAIDAYLTERCAEKERAAADPEDGKTHDDQRATVDREPGQDDDPGEDPGDLDSFPSEMDATGAGDQP